MITSAVTLRKLHHVVMLARAQNFARAAEQVNLSKSALSRSIQATEADLGLTLFRRGKRGVFTTPAGARIVTAATALLAGAAEFNRTVGRQNVNLAEVTFGMGPVPASIFLGPLTKYAILHGGLRAHTQVLPAVQLLERLTAGKIEFFVCALGVTPYVAHVATELLGTFPVVARVRPGHPLAGISGVTADAYGAFPQVGTAMVLDDLAVNTVDERHHPTVAINDYRLAVETLMETDAICLFLKDFPQSGLVDLDCAPGVHITSGQLGLCYVRSGAVSEAAEGLMSEVRAVAARILSRSTGSVSGRETPVHVFP